MIDMNMGWLQVFPSIIWTCVRNNGPFPLSDLILQPQIHDLDCMSTVRYLGINKSLQYLRSHYLWRGDHHCNFGVRNVTFHVINKCAHCAPKRLPIFTSVHPNMEVLCSNPAMPSANHYPGRAACNRTLSIPGPSCSYKCTGRKSKCERSATSIQYKWQQLARDATIVSANA